MYMCVRGEMGKTNDGKEKRCGRRKSADLGQRSRQNEGVGDKNGGAFRQFYCHNSSAAAVFSMLYFVAQAWIVMLCEHNARDRLVDINCQRVCTSFCMGQFFAVSCMCTLCLQTSTG